jgi:hypothetical protein
MFVELSSQSAVEALNVGVPCRLPGVAQPQLGASLIR